MKDKETKRWTTYEPFYVELDGRKVADIVITNHACERWTSRISAEGGTFEAISAYLWSRLKDGQIAPYYQSEQDVYLVDGDLVVVADFGVMEHDTDVAGNPLYKMIVITFLGKLSETIELRDLRSYYAWLRHSRRMTLVKNSRKRR